MIKVGVFIILVIAYIITLYYAMKFVKKFENPIKHTILCIVGASGSGKTTLSLKLNELYNIPYISSYTTREMRSGETNGVEHIFVTENDIPDEKDMFAYTLFGNNHYWTTYKQINKHPICTYVIDEKGVLYFKEKCKNLNQYDIKFIKVIRDNLNNIDTERKNRDNDRIEIPDDVYDIIIYNNGTVDEMVNTTVKLLNL